ncbi:hypothetical protein RHE_CH02509 [Rhizobium etli CFN 42]|uniref:Lipoprotein n=2 Tax=Rhizobium etli TaxID=29449 RepID=Q2K7A0_RHIEC|nr:hypothetical protein [Rhizobium etli]ABC91286.1 hypothetical protein RHE_CH02509 [Rhizobium etli CFN 42]ARQ10587.1 hypothetical protein NXC12_CH02576 [Rhizobium etli]
MRLLINVFVATMMLLGSLAASCIAGPADHGHAAPVFVSVPATSEGHHRSDGRSISGTHCQQDGIIAQASEAHYSHPDTITFIVVAPIALVGTLDPVEQRPPIAFSTSAIRTDWRPR